MSSPVLGQAKKESNSECKAEPRPGLPDRSQVADRAVRPMITGELSNARMVLAPDIVEAIVVGQQPPTTTLGALMGRYLFQGRRSAPTSRNSPLAGFIGPSAKPSYFRFATLERPRITRSVGSGAV
jgi:hypothetical protein